MSVEKEQFDKVMGELRRACLPAGGADAVQAYVDSLAGDLARVEAERRHDLQIQSAMAADQKAVADALGIPPGEYSGGAGEQLLAIEKLREALARMEAERDTAIVQMQNIRTNRDRLNKQLGDTEFNLCIAQQRLTEAAGLLRKIDSEIWPEWDRHGSQAAALVNVQAFLADYDQAEQQEAQGAQAGDERAAFEAAAQTLSGLVQLDFSRFADDSGYTSSTVEWGFRVWQKRAALATQPAVPVSAEAMSFEYAHISGERRTVSITREDVIEGMEDALYEKLSDQICRCEPIGETNVVECNCQDYVEEFTLVSAKPAVRGAEHA